MRDGFIDRYFGDKLIFNGTLRIISYIGGSDAVENLISASNRHTFQIKSATPEEVGWKVLPAGNLNDWDGTLSWFMGYVDKNPEVKKVDYIKKCYKACVALKVS